MSTLEIFWISIYHPLLPLYEKESCFIFIFILFFTGILVADLKKRHITVLSGFLDETILDIPDCFDLGELILKDDAEGLNIIKNLRRKYVGGSPGRAFLNALGVSRPMLTIKGFIDVSKDLDRNDIHQLLKGVDSSTLLSELEHLRKDLYIELVHKLEVVGSAAVRNWR